MKVETIFGFGEIVYFKLGDQPKGVVTRIDIMPASGNAVSIMYWVSLENGETKPFYEFELTTEKTFVHEPL